MSKHRKASKRTHKVLVALGCAFGFTFGSFLLSLDNEVQTEVAGQFNEEARVEAGRVNVADNTFTCKDEGWTKGVVLQVQGGWVSEDPNALVPYTEEEQRCVQERWITEDSTILVDIYNNVFHIDNEVAASRVAK